MSWIHKPPDALWVEIEMDLCGRSELVNLLDDKISVSSEFNIFSLIFATLHVSRPWTVLLCFCSPCAPCDPVSPQSDC